MALSTRDQREDVKFFDMLEGYRPIRNVLGLGDPNVHKFGDRWVMFLGGATANPLKTNLFCATLPPGAPLSSNEWSVVTVEGRPHLARALVPPPPKGGWDGYGLHTPSYVRGVDPRRGEQERVYYSGRASRQSTGPTSRYAIGYLERTATGWARHGDPVLTGTPARPSVFEPKVRYDDGTWRMWYVSAPHEVGRGEQPDYQLEYVESEDGIRWSAPTVLFTTADGYRDAVVIQTGDGYGMALTRGSNLFGEPGLPPQGLWWLSSSRLSGDRADWSPEPVDLLDMTNPLPWYANGVFGPSPRFGDTDADRDVLYVFFTGVHRRIDWPRLAARRIRSRRLPPVPAPFHFAVGRAQYRLPAG